MLGTISQYDDNIKFTLYRMDKEIFDDDLFLYDPVELYSTNLDWTSFFYKSILDNNHIVKSFNYQIPYSSMGVTFEKGQQYQYELSYKDSSGTICYYRRDIVMGSVTETEKLQDSLNKGLTDLGNNINSNTDKIIESNNKTQEAIKEQTQVSKNIFEKIGEMLSYINPFSENFFVYKLIELLIEMLKSLFIPSNEFFNTFFTDLNSWFSDRFGFLYYPLELFFDLCDRFVNIDFSEPIINIPDIIEPTTNLVLIHSTYYNFNSLLENDILKTVHDIYFIIVDAVIYIGLALLLYNKYEEVMTK